MGSNGRGTSSFGARRDRMSIARSSAERSEEWRIAVAGDGTIRTLRHTLPQARPGARLTKDAALAIAERELRDKFAVDPSAVKLVAADETNLVARADWAFMFTDP